MRRLTLIPLLLALSSCKQEEAQTTESATNESAERLRKQKEDLTNFMADFKTSMNSKYRDPGLVPEIENIGLLRIEGTKVFNYNFNLTLEKEDQVEPVKNELHRLMLAHQVETINSNIRTKFQVPPSRRQEFLGSWCLTKDGTVKKSRNGVGRETDATQRVLDRINKRPE